MKQIDISKVRIKHIIAIALILLISVGITLLIKPLYINWYLDQQPIDEIWSSSVNASSYDMMGKVIVLRAHVSIVRDGDNLFEFIDKPFGWDGKDGRINQAYYTDLMNCRPTEGLNRKIAVAWNVNNESTNLYKSRNISLYALWVIDGC